MQPGHENKSTVAPGERPSAPFTCNILKDGTDGDSDSDTLLNQFPASYRVRQNDDLHAPRIPGPDLIARELDVKRLHNMIRRLWFAGRPVPPRPLHIQRSLGRELVVHEMVEVHLVWGQGRIFLKPLPRYLLNPKFWVQYLSCDSCAGYRDIASPEGSPTAPPCTHQHLRACALGFLLSYVALIAHESDFAIAKEKNLIPAEITWPQWRLLVHQILTSTETGSQGSSNALYTQVAPRYIYGELRLNRLNLILFAFKGPFSAGYMSTWQSYGSFLRANSDWIITGTAYIIVVLSAMQVGLSTDVLMANKSFQDTSYGFTVFSIIMPIVAVIGLILVSAALWTYNIILTRRFEAQRARVLGRTWRRDGKSKKRREKISTGILGEAAA